MRLLRTIGFAWLLGVYAVEAVVYSTGSLNQDWLNASNWGGTDPAAHSSETFIIKSGHILGPVDGSPSATLWPSAGLRVESGGIFSLDKGPADFSQASLGLELNGGRVRVTASAIHQEAELVGDITILAASSLTVDADMLTLSGGTISGSGALSLTRSIRSPEAGDGFPALALRSTAYDYSGNIDTSSWSGWGRFVVQNGNWGTGDFTLNPMGGGVLRPGAAFNAHGRLFVPNSTAKVDLKGRTNILLPGSSFGGNEITSTYNWVNDNTVAFTDVPTPSGSANLSSFLLNIDRAAISIANPIADLIFDANNLFDLDEPMSMKNMAAIVEKANDVDLYRQALSDSNQLPYGLEYWRWGEPYSDICGIEKMYQLTRDATFLDSSMVLADTIKAYADAHPNEMPGESNALEMSKFFAPAVSARIIFEHALIYPDEVTAAQLTKAKDYLDWSIALFNRFAVQDREESTRPEQLDTWNGLYSEANRTLTRPWNRQLWWSVPCAITREAISAYVAFNPSETAYLEDAENYSRIIAATAAIFDWNADLRSYGDHDYAFWCYGTERNYAAPKNAEPGWADACYEGQVLHHQNEDTPHSGPDLYSFYYFAQLADKHAEYTPFRDLAKRTIFSMVDHSAKRANPPSSGTDPRKGPLYEIMPPWREDSGIGLKDSTTYLPAGYAMSCADYYPEIYRTTLSAQARGGALDHIKICFLISGKLSYLEASKGTPAAPLFVTQQSSSRPRIDWPISPEPDVTGYNVYRASSSGGPYRRIATDVAQTEYTDPSGSGSYVVTAVDSSGNESAASAEATAFVVPATPSGLSIQNQNDGAELTWNTSSSPDVVSYTVYRSHGGATPFYPIRTGITDSTWVDTTPYVDDIQANPPHYKVKAVNSKYIESNFSNEITFSQNSFVVYGDVMRCSTDSVTADLTANDVLVLWDSPVDIHAIGDSIISTNGTQVESANMKGSLVTVNGETFSDVSPFITTLYGDTTDGNIYNSGNVGSPFESMLDSIGWLDKRPAYIYMDHMEAGKSYELQLLVSDARSSGQKVAKRQFCLYGVQSPSHAQTSYSQICRFTANRRILNLELSHKGDNATVSLCGYQIREINSIQNLALNSFTQPAHGQVTQNGNQVTYVPNPGFTGKDSFTYQVTETNSGETGTGVVEVIVSDPTTVEFGNLPPKAIIQATPRLGAAPLMVQLDASESSDDGAIVAYEWDFDNDGEVDATGPTTAHTYTAEGQYPISLRLTDDQGKQGIKTVTVLVGNPLAPRVWYTFDETAGSTVKDHSGNGFDGTLNQAGAWISSGKDGGALDFNGVTSITVPDGVFSTIEQELTMSFWIHDQGRSFTDCRLFSASCPQGSWRSNFPWGSYEVKFEFAGDYVRYDTSNFDDIGKDWTHWVVIKNVPTQGVKIYRNGMLEVDWPDRSGTLENTTRFILGTSGSDYFHGAVDDFRIYDRVLSPSEVSEIYHQTEVQEGIAPGETPIN